MSKLEKTISRDVKTTLSALELAGSVLWHERLNSGKVRTEYGSWLQLCRRGTADFIAILPVKDGVMVYFIETKAENGQQTAEQKLFQKTVEEWGAIYEVVRDVSQVKITVENITGFYANKLKNIDY